MDFTPIPDFYDTVTEVFVHDLSFRTVILFFLLTNAISLIAP